MGKKDNTPCSNILKKAVTEVRDGRSCHAQCPYPTPKKCGKKDMWGKKPLEVCQNFEKSELKRCVGSPEINETSVKINAVTTLRALQR